MALALVDGPTTMVIRATQTVGIKQIGGHEMGVGWKTHGAKFPETQLLSNTSPSPNDSSRHLCQELFESRDLCVPAEVSGAGW